MSEAIPAFPSPAARSCLIHFTFVLSRFYIYALLDLLDLLGFIWLYFAIFASNVGILWWMRMDVE
jgi:hypothetical protein